VLPVAFPTFSSSFLNIEVRLDVAARSGFVNLHLLVSPEDPDHLVEVRRILTRLQFNAHGDRFDCTREELIRLGKRADPTIKRRASRARAWRYSVLGEQVWRIVDPKFLDPSYNHHDPRWIRDQLLAVANPDTSQTYTAVRSTLQLLGDPQTRLLKPVPPASTVQELEGAAGGIEFSPVKSPVRIAPWPCLHVLRHSPTISKLLGV